MLPPASTPPPSPPDRAPLCRYFSADAPSLLREVRGAYLLGLGLGLPAGHPPPRPLAPAAAADPRRRLLALVVPHGAAQDGFLVAARAYRELAACLRRRRCGHLTAVLLGTEHRCSTPIALSRAAWRTPLGLVPVDAEAGELLGALGVRADEAPHAGEHSIENQLPFLQHAAAWRWDLSAAGCLDAGAAVAAAAAPAAAAAGPPGGAAPPAQPAAGLSIVPVSVGYLGDRPEQIARYGAALRALLRHLRLRGAPSAAAEAGGGGAAAEGGHEAVLIVTSDLTHAGPGYGELPPPGVALEQYMAAQVSGRSAAQLRAGLVVLRRADG
jgi:hypothetical protein